MPHKSHYAIFPLDPAVLQQIDFASFDAPPSSWKCSPLSDQDFFDVCAHNWIVRQGPQLTLKDLALFDFILSYPQWLNFQGFSMQNLCQESAKNLPWLRSFEQIASIYFQSPGAYLARHTQKIFDHYVPSELLKKKLPTIFQILYRVLFWRLASLAPYNTQEAAQPSDPSFDTLSTNALYPHVSPKSAQEAPQDTEVPQATSEGHTQQHSTEPYALLCAHAKALAPHVTLGTNRSLYANTTPAKNNPVSLDCPPKHWRHSHLFYQSAHEGPLPTLLGALLAYGSSALLTPIEPLLHKGQQDATLLPHYLQKAHPLFWQICARHPHASAFELMFLYGLHLLPHPHFEFQYNAGTFASLVRLACYRKSSLLLGALVEHNAHFDKEWFESMGTINSRALHPVFDAFNAHSFLVPAFLEAHVDLLAVHEEQQLKQPQQKSLLLHAVSCLNISAIKLFAHLDMKDVLNAYLYLCRTFKEHAHYESAFFALHAHFETLDPKIFPNLFATIGSIQSMCKNKALLRFLKAQRMCFTHLIPRKHATDHSHLLKEPVHSTAYKTFLEFLLLQSSLLPFQQQRKSLPCLFSNKSIPLLQKNEEKKGKEGGSKRL